jgi:SAM-dependent methyltransferase
MAPEPEPGTVGGRSAGAPAPAARPRRRTGPARSRPSPDASTLARYYDLDLTDDPGDLDLYLALAARTGGPVLELCAGTGRLSVPLAAAGYEVEALDRDPAMLERARKRWAGEVDARRVAPGGQLRTVAADLFVSDEGSRFSLVMLPLNSLFLLGERSRQAAAIEVMARHLRPGGLAVVDAWLPGVDDLSLFDGRLILEWLRTDPETGAMVTKTGSAAYDHARRRIDLTTIFEASPRFGGAVMRHVRTDVLHLLSADEIVDAATAAGLRVEQLAGDYDLAPFAPGCGRAVLVAGLV